MVQTLWDSITQSITGAPSADDIRRRREDESAFSSLYDAARQRDAELAAAGRRPVLGGLLSKEPVAGMDTLRYEGITPLILGLLSPVARAVDAPMAAYQGNIPMQDMAGEALGTAGMAALGGAALTRPAGSVGMGGRVAGESNVRQSVRGMIGDQMDLTMDLVGPDGQQQGRVDYSVYDGQPAIQMIEVAPEFRRQGVATELLRILQREYPEQEIDWGSLTSDGSQLYNSTRFLDVDQTGGAGRLLPDLEARVRAAEADYLSTFSNDFQGDASAIRESFYRLEDELEVARAAAALPPKRLIDLAANRDQTVGLLSTAAAAEPRNAAERMARNILEMRAAGRAGDVTEEMRAAADPMYMYQNTPLPMDEVSRMARAREMGRVDDQYHATLADFQAFRPSETGLVGRGVYSGDFPTDIEDYARKQGTSDGLNIIPLLAPSEQTYARRIDWQNLVDADEAFPWNATVDETIQGFKRAADTMSSQGYSGVNSQPGERATFDPASLRSRFALFDPEFRHLRNLSAGIGGLGLLATQMPEQQRDEEIRQYLGGLL